MTPERDAYGVLQVQSAAAPEVISAAYRVLARRFHPDGPTPDPARMAELNRAYNELKTSQLRRRYDSTRGLVAMGPGRPPTAVPPAGSDSPPAPPSSPFARHVASGAEGAVVDFGRYAGWRIVDVAHHDPDYLRWLSRHSAGVRFRDAIGRCLPGDRELGRRAAIVY